jgi:hypothetical protein
MPKITALHDKSNSRCAEEPELPSSSCLTTEQFQAILHTARSKMLENTIEHVTWDAKPPR